MKTPLRYQASEFDCGPTAVLNAISFLYDTKEIPPEFVKKIYEVSLDEYDGKMPHRRGTSTTSMRYLADWFNRYAQQTGFPIKAASYIGTAVHLGEDSPILQCLRDGGTAVVKCILEEDHYITLTGIEGSCVHVFDPYFEDYDIFAKGVTFVSDRPKEMNRMIDISLMDCNGQCDYAFCSVEKRCAMLIYKTK